MLRGVGSLFLLTLSLACTAKDGATGPMGPQGLQGPQGAQGAQGAQGQKMYHFAMTLNS